MSLSGLWNELLIAELQAALCKSQDVAVVLAGRTSETAKELAAGREANAELELEVRQLKETAPSDKEALATSRWGLEAAEQKVNRGARAELTVIYHRTPRQILYEERGGN